MAALRFVFPLFLLGSIILSAGPLFVRLADVGPVQSAFWRLAIGAPMLLLLVRAVEGRIPSLPSGWSIVWLVLGGLFFAADLASWHLGIERTTLANSTLLGNAAAFLFPVWGYAVVRRWPTPVAGLALLLAAAGIVTLSAESASVSPANLAGDLFCLLAAIFYTGYLIVMNRARAGLSALSALSFATMAGALFLLPVALLDGGAFWPKDWTPLLILALSSQVAGQGLIIYALPHLPPLASGIGLLVQPLFSGLLGFLWFAEILTMIDIAGMTMIFVAILLVRRPSKAMPRVEKRVPPTLGGAQAPDC
jgi:drug/metabolite transporter (DMT)-like permease